MSIWRDDGFRYIWQFICYSSLRFIKVYCFQYKKFYYGTIPYFYAKVLFTWTFFFSRSNSWLPLEQGMKLVMHTCNKCIHIYWYCRLAINVYIMFIVAWFLILVPINFTDGVPLITEAKDGRTYVSLDFLRTVCRIIVFWKGFFVKQNESSQAKIKTQN